MLNPQTTELVLVPPRCLECTGEWAAFRKEHSFPTPLATGYVPFTAVLHASVPLPVFPMPESPPVPALMFADWLH